MHAYLDDLAAVGYGRGKVGVARRFIENAITAALETKVIPTRKAADFDDAAEDDD